MSGGDRIAPHTRVFGAVLWLVLMGVLLVHVADSAAAGHPKVLSILVMGDSYSAGNGAGDYHGPRGCRRSYKNYAEQYETLVEAAPYHQKATVANVACSGDTTSAFFNAESGRPKQLVAVNHGYNLIFLTIGGNDIHFADLVEYCLIARFRDGAHCRQDLDRALTLLKDGTMEGAIKGVLSGIELAADPRAKIVLLGYPYLGRFRLSARRPAGGETVLQGRPVRRASGRRQRRHRREVPLSDRRPGRQHPAASRLRRRRVRRQWGQRF
ncbi:MAG: GDSL-type esterase/lipase family protein [Solirubrobacteraceae bacterium]